MGFPVGGGNSSHRGFGFALGHPQFQLPSRNAPLRQTVTQRANSVGRNHGSAEHGASPGTGNARDREPRRRDRSPSSANLVGDPVQQATAYRLEPAGPQDAESIQDAYENVINRLLTVENHLRKHAQLDGAHSELATANFQRHAEMIETNTKKCKWLYGHLNNTTGGRDGGKVWAD